MLGILNVFYFESRSDATGQARNWKGGGFKTLFHQSDVPHRHESIVTAVELPQIFVGSDSCWSFS
jgi:hypothetical protein